VIQLRQTIHRLTVMSPRLPMSARYLVKQGLGFMDNNGMFLEAAWPRI
jgi:hypothetical protein